MLALVVVAAVTMAMLGLIRMTGLSHGSIIYIIPVIVAAIGWGIVPALAAAIAGVIVSAFFFYAPIYSLQVANPQQILDLSLFVFVAVVTGQLAARLKSQAEIARRRERDMRDLYAFSRRLAMAFDMSDIHVAIQEHLSAVIQRKVILFGTTALAAQNGTRRNDDQMPQAVRAMAEQAAAGDNPSSAGMIVTDEGNDAWLVRAVSSRTPEFGIIAIDLSKDSPDAINEMRLRVEAVLADAAATLERLGLAGAIGEARLRAETEQLREALIGSVSHELRTPLASILGAATVLHGAPALANDQRLLELVGVVRDEAERLNNDIQNFLDATRISSEGIKPRLEWTDPGDIINSALERCRKRIGNHRIALDIADDLPLIFVDSILVEQALVQIIDNAAKYSPPDSTIRILIHAQPNSVALTVSDTGIGLTAEEMSRLWERFFRGERHSATVSGSGLGLWIAQAFIVANGGKLAASSEGMDRGTTIAIDLPLGQNSILQKMTITGDSDG